MQPAEFNALRAIVRDPDAKLASDLGVSVAQLRKWETGAARVPRFEAQLLRFIAGSAERGQALQRSGLPECDWMNEFDVELPPTEHDALMSYFAQMEEHHSSCATCQARERFVEARFGPMPALPTRGLAAVFSFVERLPEALRPAAYGASALAAIVSLRAVFAIPSIIERPETALELLLAVVAAAAAGASGGLAVTLVRPMMRSIGRLGDYLTGIVCVGTYMTFLALVFPIAFGEDLLKDRFGWYAFGFVILLFGPVVGHALFRPASKRSNTSARAN